MKPLSTFLKHLEVGDQFAGTYLLRSVQPRVARNGSTYWDIELADRSGRLVSRTFHPPEEVPGNLPVPVYCEGVVETYSQRKIAKIFQIDTVDPEKVDWELLIPVSKRPREELIADLQTRVSALTDEWYRKLWELLLADESWFERYANAPAGKLWHHTFRSGLLEHSLSIADHCALAAQHHPLADKDLLFCGAMLHDVGKVWELTPLPAADYTEPGRMLGHIYLGANFISKKMEQIEGFPSRHRLRLLHLILSHQGTRAQGSPVVPASLEAKILYCADELDAQAEAYEHIINNSADGERLFSEFIPLADTFIYLGDRANLQQPTVNDTPPLDE